MTVVQVVRDLAGLARADLDAWDALAVAAGRPYAAPGWLVPWARHAAGVEPLVVLVRGADGRPAGVAPFGVRRPAPGVRLAVLLSEGTAGGVTPLARPGAEGAVAAAAARALADARVGAVRLHGLPPGPDWPGLLAAAWPGRGADVRELHAPVPAPALVLGEDGWAGFLAAKRSKSRKRLLQGLEQLERAGVRSRVSTGDRLPADLATFVRLHHARWEGRDGSRALTPAIEAMLRDVADELPAPGRLRLWVLEQDDRPVAAELFVAAGDRVSSWLGGFDEAFAELRPSVNAVLLAVRDAAARGERRVDYGPGAAEFKARLADGQEPLRSVAVLPRGLASAPGRAALLAVVRARAGWDALPEERRALLRRPLSVLRRR